MSRHGTLDLDRYSSLENARRSASRNQLRVQPKPGEVLCDFCTARKQQAEKSCLVCLASYCETHLQSHYEYPALMKHKLVRATGQMREKICAQHDKLLEAFCRTDQTSVCVLCMMDEHKHHDIVPAGTERTEKQVGAVRTRASLSFNKDMERSYRDRRGGWRVISRVDCSTETTRYRAAQITAENRPED